MRKTCEACGGRPAFLRVVGHETTGDKGAVVCSDSTACQRRMVAKNRRRRRRK
jgi:alpha-D-ribose 1-methylphosphonate 5-phosphate C-P lyase